LRLCVKFSLMNEFSRKLITEWRKLDLPFTGKTFVVAISGGADSVSLALALNELKTRKKLNLRFVLAHFNHDLRAAESDEDENFVKEFAERFNFELVCKIQNPQSPIQNQTGNLEQNARQARYAFLTETAQNLKADGILTAHTLNDQAETFLLNLIRGSGLGGLGGMKPIRLFEEENGRRGEEELVVEYETSSSPFLLLSSSPLLIRPLLSWAKREDTENFCHLNEVEFRHDRMNDDLKFNRVRIRKVLLPLLKDFNPKIVETLAKTSALLRDGAEQLANRRQDSTENILSESRTAETKINIETLVIRDIKNLFPSMRQIILRDWLKDNRGNLRRLELKHIEAVEKLIFSRKSGKIVELPNGESVLKKQGILHFQKTKVD